MGKHRADRDNAEKGSEGGVSRRHLLRTGGAVAGLGAAAVFLGRGGVDITEESWRRHWRQHPSPSPSATSSSAAPSTPAVSPSASPSPTSPQPTPSQSTSSAPPSSKTGKVVRVGTGLQLNGSPFRMVGFNIWQATVNTWNAPVCGHVAVNAGTTLQSWLAGIRATAPRVNVIRTWFFQQFAMNAGARDWSAFDKVLSVCDAAGFKVIACLEDNWSYERQGSQQPALSSAWFSGGYSTTVLPHEGKTYRAWVAEVVARYAGDPRIAVWELVNEGNAMTQGFAADVSGLIKSIDSLTPVGCGGVGGGFPGLATIDLVSYHYYTNYGQTGWQSTQQAAAAAGKPWYIGEGGFNPSGSRPQEFQSLMSSVFSAANSAGFVAWQFANQGGDGFDIGTGDPALPVLNSFA